MMIFIWIGLNSCEKIKSKAEQVGEDMKRKGKKSISSQLEKLYPPFDHDRPDTDNNKKRFEDFLKIELTPDIMNIYCFDNAIGIDASYMFSFNCDPATSERIIIKNNLIPDTLNMNTYQIQYDFSWWDKEVIFQLQEYSWTDGGTYFKQYWYDEKNRKAYYFDFDL